MRSDNLIEFNLLGNGLDFIIKSLDPILDSSDKNELKYSLLHLSSGVELLLKERLRLEHWSLLFENVNGARFDLLENATFKSVTFETLILRLNNIAQISLDTSQSKYFKELRSRRNKIEHFSCQENSVSIKSLVSKVLAGIFSFLQDHFDTKLFPEKATKQIKSLRGKSTAFNKFVRDRFLIIKVILNETDKNTLLNCPHCFQNCFVFSEDLYCIFCGFSDIPSRVADEFINYINLGKSSNNDFVKLTCCDHCNEQYAICYNDFIICFNCFYKT